MEGSKSPSGSTSDSFEDPRRTFAKVFYDQEGFAIQDKPIPAKYDLELAQWIVCEFDWSNDIRRITWINDAMVFAVRESKLEILEFAFAKLEMLPGPIFTAYRIQRPKFYKWHEPTLEVTRPLCEEVYEKQLFGPSIIDAAAANGHLPILQWLHACPHQECTINAMDEAAANGHLNVVKWLHQNRSECCTYKAMNEAAGNGYLQIVQWLRENRSVGCTTQAMDVASRN